MSLATAPVDPPPSDTHPRHGRRQGLLLVLLLAVLALAVGESLEREPSEGLLPEETVVAFDPSAIRAATRGAMGWTASGATAGRAWVVHVRLPGCPCSELADARFLALASRHAGSDVVFAFSEPPGTPVPPVRGLERFTRLPAAVSEGLWRTMPAAPGIVVFDADGQAQFAGAYSREGHCSAARGGPVDAMLATAAPEAPAAEPGPAPRSGCTCPTPR